jgi:hypothetical protein
MINNELFLNCNDIQDYIRAEIQVELRTPGKNCDSFSTKILRILTNFQKNVLTSKTESDIIKE